MIQTILEEWKYLIDRINQFHDRKSDDYYEEGHVLPLFHKLASFLQMYESEMRKWMMNYLQAHRRDILVRWWTDHVKEWAMDQIKRFPDKKLHPRVVEEWDRLVGSTPFSTIHRFVMKHHTIRDISHCDQPEIIAIHKGKVCDDWPCCFLCDESEEKWREEVKQRLEKGLAPLLTLRQTPDFLFENWSPPHSYYNDSHEYLNKNDYKLYLCERRMEKYKPNQTSRQMITTLIYESLSCGGWSLPHWNPRDDYELFLLLWNCVDMIQTSIRIDTPHITHIEQMIQRFSSHRFTK